MVRFLPQRGFDSEYTQATANHLPVWHKIRYDPTATGQYMLNSFSEGVSEIQHYLKNARKDMYVSTADTLVRTHGYRAAVPQNIKVRENRLINILRNSSFRYQGQAWKNHPLEWQVTSGETYLSDTYAGHASIKLNQSGEFYQIVSGEEFRKGQEYTSSVWMKSASFDEDLRGTLRMDAEGWGWSQFDEFTFKLGTTGEWIQQAITITPTGDIRSLKITLTSQPTGDIDVLFSAPMMQEGGTVNPWEPGADDQIADFRIFMVGPTGEEQQLIELDHVTNEHLLFEDAIPQRMETTPGITGDVTSDNFAPPAYEWTKDVWDCEFRISGDVIEKYSTRIPADVWNGYTILDRYMDNEVNTGEYGYSPSEVASFSRKLEALCVWRRRIYIVLKDTVGGNVYRVLKILRWQGVEDRLETIHELRVGMDTGDVSTIGFIEGRMDQMALMMSDATEWTMQLYFDTFLHDTDREQVVLRHPYDGYTLTFAEL